MTLQNRSSLTHPQLPSTSEDWSNFSHALHSTLINSYGTNIKAGKLHHALAQSANFSNAHAMTRELDTMFSAINQDLSVAFKLSDDNLKATSTRTKEISFLLDVTTTTIHSLDFYKGLILQVMLGDKSKIADNKESCLAAVDFGTLETLDQIETMAIEQSHHIDGGFDNIKIVSVLKQLFPVFSEQAHEAVNALRESECDTTGYDNGLQYRIEFLRAIAVSLVIEASLILKCLIKNTFNLNEQWLEKAREALIHGEQEKGNMAQLLDIAAEKACVAFFKVADSLSKEINEPTTDNSGAGIHTLVYSERTQASDALCTMNGPTVHSSHKEAVSELFSYVKNRILETCPDAFVEMIEEERETEFNLKKHSDFEKKSKEILDSLLTTEQQESYINWFFELMNDDTVECYYKITKH